MLRRTIFSQWDSLPPLNINWYQRTAVGERYPSWGGGVGGGIPAMNRILSPSRISSNNIYPSCSTAQNSLTGLGNYEPQRRNGHLVFTCCARQRIFSQEINHISSVTILSIPHKATDPFSIVRSWSFQQWKIKQFTDNIFCRDWFGLERLGNIVG